MNATLTATDTRPYCYATKQSDGSYIFESNDNCRFPGLTGRVWHHDTLGWLAEVDGMIQDWPFGGATAKEAARNAIEGAWDGMQWRRQCEAKGRW